MARISGVNIPTNKKVSVGLTYIHGIGDKSALDICEKAGIDKDKRVNELLETEVIPFPDPIKIISSKSSTSLIEISL